MLKKIYKSLLEDDGSPSNKPKEENVVPVEKSSGSSTFPTQITNDVYNQTTQKMDDYISTQPTHSSPIYVPNMPKVDVPIPNPVNHLQNCDNEVKSVLGVYEKMLADNNQDGYDFFEFYKTIMENDPNNIPLYQMVFNIAKSVDKNITSDKLKSSAEYYLKLIIDSFTNFDNECTIRLNQLDAEKEKRKVDLTDRLKTLETQMQDIKTEIEYNLKTLGNIDNEYAEKIEANNCFKYANTVIKDKMVESLSLVKNNINF